MAFKYNPLSGQIEDQQQGPQGPTGLITTDAEVGSGSVSAPAYSFNGDSNTGIYRVADGVIGVSSNNNTCMLISHVGVITNAITTTEFTSNNSTVAEGHFINNKNNGTGNNASLILSNDSGTRKKASISLIDKGNYGAGDLIFALDGTDSDSLNLSTDEKVRITLDGKVLIGVTSSYANAAIDDLQVGNANSSNKSGISIGSTDECAIAFANAGDARAGSIIYNHGSDAMIFKTDGQNERLHITSSGNVGIGVTPKTWSLGRGLEIGDSSNASWGEGKYALHIFQNAYYNSGYKRVRNEKVAQYTQYQGSHRFSSAASGAADSAISFSELVRITNDGKVLIGTTSNRAINTHEPRLQISGNDYKQSTVSIINNANDATGPHLFFTKQRSGAAGGSTAVVENDILGDLRFTAADGGDVESGAARITVRAAANATTNSTPGYITFSTSTTNDPQERVRISSGGKVSIGESTAHTYSAHVAVDDLVVGGGSSHGITVLSGNTSTGSLWFDAQDSTRGYIQYAHNEQALILGTEGNERLRINSDGKVGIGTTVQLLNS